MQFRFSPLEVDIKFVNSLFGLFLVTKKKFKIFGGVEGLALFVPLENPA